MNSFRKASLAMIDKGFIGDILRNKDAKNLKTSAHDINNQKVGVYSREQTPMIKILEGKKNSISALQSKHKKSMLMVDASSKMGSSESKTPQRNSILPEGSMFLKHIDVALRSSLAISKATMEPEVNETPQAPDLNTPLFERLGLGYNIPKKVNKLNDDSDKSKDEEELLDQLENMT